MIIGLTGKAGSGKDTVADYLHRKYGFVPFTIAAPLKAGVSELFGIDRGVMEDSVLKEQIDDRYGVTPRKILQRLGTDYVRKEFGEDFFIHRLIQRITPLLANDENIVITDVRFNNELQRIKEIQGVHTVFWNISADERLPGGTSLQDDTASHISEQPLNPMFSMIELNNNGTIDELHDKIDGLMR